MSYLVILLPARERLRAAGAAGMARGAAEYDYVTSSDGLTVAAHGRAAVALLPRADTVIAVVGDTDAAWHRITLPKAPATRLRAALAGVLEDALLDDADAMQLALAPGAAAGEPTWVAAVHRGWLVAHLAALEQGGRPVERVVPASWPDETAMGHVWLPEGAAAGDTPMLTWSDAEGVATLRLQGGMARAMEPLWKEQAARWTATPAAAAPAERWLGAPVRVMSDAERALQATRSLWNLRQFDLAARHRGVRALRDLGRQLLGPAWRPARWGLAALIVVHLAGLNLWAWHQRDAVAERRQAMVDLLRSAHPQVRAVLDAPLQMQRETAVLRAAAGRAGDTDLEALLLAAAGAWPDGQGPAQALRFEGGRLTITVAAWAEPQVEAFRQRLRAAGWHVEAADGRLTVSRTGAAGVSS